MGKKYLYVAGDSFSVIGGNSIEVPHDEESIQHRRHLNDKESLKSWELTEESEKNEKLYQDALQKERDSQWNVKLAKLLNLEVIYGGAIVGGSNQRASIKLRNFLLSDKRAKDSIVIWQWTTTERDSVFLQKYGYWVNSTKQFQGGDNLQYWQDNGDVSKWSDGTNKINRFIRSDLLDAYYLIEETKIIHLMAKNIGAKFFAFNGMVNIGDYLNLHKKDYFPHQKVLYKLTNEYKEHLGYDTTKIVERDLGEGDSNVYISDEYKYLIHKTRSDVYHHPVFLTREYHESRVSLYEEMLSEGILIKPHGYENWSEALKHHKDLDRGKVQGAWVTPGKQGKKAINGISMHQWIDERRNSCTYEEYLSDDYLMYGYDDLHPGHQARKLFAEFLAEKINDR
jgi:hypothetical protein|tara:strand:- start:283 stop:1470 length:1188 start_codon:yes stop_codon:yes gene_type:complete